MIKRLFSLALLALVQLVSHIAAAEEAASLSLLDANSLAGWDHAAERPQGWQIRDGQLTGNADSTPLLSGWTFGNFELSFDWHAKGGGKLRVSLPSVPRGAGIELTLGEDADGCQLAWDGKRSAARVPLARSGKSRATTIRRQDESLSVTIDGQQQFHIELSSETRFGLGLAVPAGEATISNLRVREFGTTSQPSGEPLFNGQDLTGWWTPGNKAAWAAENGELVLVGKDGNYLRTEKLYANFTLSLEYKIRHRGNSGIGIRTARDGWPSSDGMELQIESGRNLDASATMAIYRNVPPIALNENIGEWNHAVIKADGAMISAWINGALVQQVNTAAMPALKHRPAQGWIGFQDHGARTQFRNIRLIAAPDGRGLDAWYTPRPEPASLAVLDRLMNPERLTRVDGIKTQRVHAEITGSGEQVLAEFVGPGAVVRIARTNDSGQLAFYFDGEAKPRLECAANKLRQALPQVCEDDNPVLTFLPYAKSLKVVLRDGSPGSYHIDAVSISGTLPVESFHSREESLARGLQPALDYRHFQIRYGTYQDHDGVPRATSGNKTIAPGERVKLITLDGAGVVQWTRLHANTNVLDNDDLWLEVTVDGEDEPVISTPARLWYAGLQGGQGFHNFLVLNKGGLLNLLPMPFAKGITIAAVNRGSKPLKGIGATVAWKKSDEQTVSPMRLVAKAVEVPAGVSASLAVAGRGRWIGYVADVVDHSNLMVEIDDQILPGWRGVSLEQWTGAVNDSQQRHCASGHWKGLAWSYNLLAPVDFERSIQLITGLPSRQDTRRLVICYVEAR